MKPIEFREANMTMSLSGCKNLPVLNDGQQILSKWKGGFWDRIDFLLFGTMWLCVKGDSQPPVWLKTRIKFVKKY